MTILWRWWGWFQWRWDHQLHPSAVHNKYRLAISIHDYTGKKVIGCTIWRKLLVRIRTNLLQICARDEQCLEITNCRGGGRCNLPEEGGDGMKGCTLCFCTETPFSLFHKFPLADHFRSSGCGIFGPISHQRKNLKRDDMKGCTLLPVLLHWKPFS